MPRLRKSTTVEGRLLVGIGLTFGTAEQYRQGDDALLHAVVDVALDPTSFVVDRVDDICKRDCELGYPVFEFIVSRSSERIPELRFQLCGGEEPLHREEEEEQPGQDEERNGAIRDLTRGRIEERHRITGHCPRCEADRHHDARHHERENRTSENPEQRADRKISDGPTLFVRSDTENAVRSHWSCHEVRRD